MSIFGVVFFVSKCLLGIKGQKNLKQFAILTWKPQSHVTILIYQMWPINPQSTAFSKTASCLLNEPPPLEDWPFPSSRILFYDNDETLGISSDRVQKKSQITRTFLVGKGRKMCQLCREQTGLCGKISGVDKVDNTFPWFKLFYTMHIVFANFDITLICFMETWQGQIQDFS